MNGTNISNTTATRIGKAILYVENNLEKKLVLEDIAKEAYFSPYHFHRLFSAVTGETLHGFIIRKRIEKAARFLMSRKEKSITEVAERVGFTNLSSFSRAFKKFYGISPNEFKSLSPDKFSKICKTKSKNGQVNISFEQYICNINNALQWLKMNANTTVKHLDEIPLAYISHLGKMDRIGEAYHRLMSWAAPKGLMDQENLRMLTIYHDSPKVTDPDHIRMSACMILNTPIKADEEVGFRTIKPTKCIVSRFELAPKDFQQAWESSFVWMVEHGYQTNDIPPFEIYYNNPNEHPEGLCLVDICIPIS